MIFGKGRWDMGRSKKDFSDKSYVALDLNEINVQAIFERCLATSESKNETRAEMFYLSLGYNEEDSTPITFDSDIISKNKKSIMYLYGQLDCVHTGEYLSEWQSMDDFAKIYTGKAWTQNKGVLLEFLYLGSNLEAPYISPFYKKFNDKARISSGIKPTLSPKDPSFPEWWEQHKAEWED